MLMRGPKRGCGARHLVDRGRGLLCTAMTLNARGNDRPDTLDESKSPQYDICSDATLFQSHKAQKSAIHVAVHRQTLRKTRNFVADTVTLRNNARAVLSQQRKFGQ